MSSASTVVTQAMQLARQERADLARQLIASLDDDAEEAEQDVEAAWLTEVERRLQATEQGTTQLEPWAVAEARIAERLRDARR